MMHILRGNILPQLIILAIFTCILLAGCTPADTPHTSTPTDEKNPTATYTPVPPDPAEPTPTETPTLIPTPLPAIVGHVEIGAGGPCDLYRLGFLDIAGQENDVYFTDPDGCKKLEQEGIQWINATFIDGEQVYYQNTELDLDLTGILEQFQELYPGVNLNQIKIHTVYDEGRGIACKDEDSEVGDIAVCVSLSQNGRSIVHLAIVIEKVVVPDSSGGNGTSGDGTSCPAGHVFFDCPGTSQDGCHPYDYTCGGSQ